MSLHYIYSGFLRLFLFAALTICTLAESRPFSTTLADYYDAGDFGTHPVNKLRTVDYNTSHILVRNWTQACDKPDEHFFITPHGFNITHNGPEILDQHGNTLWFGHEFNNSYNLRPQQYRGEDYLTWWSGAENHGHGKGNFYMMDQHYRLVKNLTVVGEGLYGDQHEFEITADNTALVMTYVNTTVDLTHFGMEGDGYIYDCYVQELDIETGELLFEWRASEHIPLEENDHGRGIKGTPNDPFDVFHLNSIQKDGKGNFLISVRHTSTVYYVSGQTGEILWRFGGWSTDFKTSRGDLGIFFFGQHHARFHHDGKIMTVFDNGNPFFGNPARGDMFAIDNEKMTADLISEVRHPRQYISTTRGSMDLEEDGSILMNYGSAPAFTEFSPDGKTIQCDYQFGSLHAGLNGSWSDHGVASYRAYRHEWHGYPLTSPDVDFDAEEKQFYVSWNGATKVRGWFLEGMYKMPYKIKRWQLIATLEKSTFESNTSAPVGEYEQFRLTAVDHEQDVLGEWIYNHNGEMLMQISLYGDYSNDTATPSHLFLALVIFAAIIAVALILKHMLQDGDGHVSAGSMTIFSRWASRIYSKLGALPAMSSRNQDREAELARLIRDRQAEKLHPS